MSIALLLEKFDVSTEEGLQKALNEIEKEEAEVDDALCGALSRSCGLEGRLRTASQAYTKLGEVKNDGQAASDMVERTAALARDVSAKVRQLDLARSRVAECQQRVNDLIDLQLCSAGVDAAIKAHDYETGAAHISRFLSMAPGSVAAARARGAPDPHETMARATATLTGLLHTKFEEAARKEDEVAISRLMKLFSQLGRETDGVDLLAKYLAKQLETSLRKMKIPDRSGGCAHADTVTSLLERAALTLDTLRKHVTALPRAGAVIQPVVCSAVRPVCSSLMLWSSKVRAEGDARATETAISELALTHSRIALYFNFLSRKAEADAAEMSVPDRESYIDAVQALILSCDLTRTAQDLLTHYLTLERYFVEESVNKALKLSQTAETSCLVDDVFFIARKVIRRATSSGSLEAVCTVLNLVGAALERDVCGALRGALRVVPPAPLPFPNHNHNHYHSGRDLDPARNMFLSVLNSAEAGAEWSEQLAEEAVAGAARLAGRGGADKLRGCAAGLAGAAAGLRAARDLGRAGIAAALLPAARAWARELVAPGTDDMTDDADALPQALEVLATAARTELSESSADILLGEVVGEIATKAVTYILQHTYTMEEGLIVERRGRRLAGWAGSNAAAARERCGVLTGCGGLLAAPVLAAPTGLATRPDLARDVLARRVDFKIEDIKKLKF